MTEKFPDDAWRLMSSMLTDQRRQRMLTAVSARTRHVKLVVQDVHNAHNVSACMRSADAFGVQDVDVVTLHEAFRASTVARGVTHWLTLNRFKAIAPCAAELKAQGYRIAVGVPREDAKPLGDLPLDRKIAVVFGNEHDGIDPEWLPHVDDRFTIPMYGMVESLNISVSAAIVLHQLTGRARAALPPAQFLLTDDEKNELLCAWICRQLPAWQEILTRLRDAPSEG